MIGGLLLAAIAGCVNSVGILGFSHQPISHMSGNVTYLGLGIAQENLPVFWRSLAAIFAFFAGGVVAGFILRQAFLRMGRRYGAVLIIESGLLFVATALWRRFPEGGEMLLAAACGLQNGMASTYSGAVVRTTHVTGMVTDFGIAFGQFLRGKAVERRRFQLYGVLLVGFFSGAFLGTLAFGAFGADTLFFPATAAGVTGTAYVVLEHRRKAQSGKATRPAPAPSY